MGNNENMSVLISGEELLFESFIIKTTTTLERIKKKKTTKSSRKYLGVQEEHVDPRRLA